VKLYRFLSGPEGFAFNQRLSLALQDGWEPWGNPVMTFDPVLKVMVIGQAIMKETANENDRDVRSLLDLDGEDEAAG